MKSFARLLTFIISFQLLVSCNGVIHVTKPLGVSVPKVDSDFTEISGSVAQVINHISNFILPSAMATEGEIIVYDVTDPNDPIEVHSEVISDSNFTIKIKKELISNRPLKINFESFEDETESRSMIVEASKTPEKIVATLNADSTIKSRITEEQLKIEIDRETVSLENSSSKLATISNKPYEAEINIINNKEAVLSLLFHSKEVAQLTSYWMAYYRIGLEKENQDITNKAKEIVTALAIKYGYLKIIKENPYLSKVASIALIEVKGFKSYEEGEKSVVSQVDMIEEKVYAVMSKDGIGQKSTTWNEVAVKVAELEKAKLEELKKSFNVNDYSMGVEKIKGISIEGQTNLDEGTKFVYEQSQIVQKEITDLMKKDGLDEKSATWINTVEAMQKAYDEKIFELQGIFIKGEATKDDGMSKQACKGC